MQSVWSKDAANNSSVYKIVLLREVLYEIQDNLPHSHLVSYVFEVLACFLPIDVLTNHSICW